MRVQRVGARAASRHFVLLRAEAWKPHEGACGPRLGITVSRKVGSAVARNRVKRRVREIFRHERPRLPGAEDLVLIARSGAAELSPEETRGEVLELLGGRGR